MSTEEQFAKRVREHLDRATSDLRPGIAYRLQQARAAAVSRVAATEPQTAPAGVVSRGGALAGGRHPAGDRPLYAQPRVWLGIALLVAAMIGYQQWSAWQDLEELEYLDTQILTSELPIDAYLDRGFQLWLKTARPDE